MDVDVREGLKRGSHEWMVYECLWMMDGEVKIKGYR